MRTDITKILQRPRTEITAREIADELGLEVKDVAIELNAMLKDGLVEREKRKGNEYTYWLANPAKNAESIPIFHNHDSNAVITEVATKYAEEKKATKVPYTEPQLIAVQVDTDLEHAIAYIAKTLPEGVSIGIFSDGSIDVVDASTDISYSPTPSTLRDFLDCFHKLQAYQQTA
jgi:predicted transcriptional regulator